MLALPQGCRLKCSSFLPVPSFIALLRYALLLYLPVIIPSRMSGLISAALGCSNKGNHLISCHPEEELSSTARHHVGIRRAFFDEPASKHFGYWAVVCPIHSCKKLDHTNARAGTSARRRPADFCQTISSSQTGAKRVFCLTVMCSTLASLCTLSSVSVFLLMHTPHPSLLFLPPCFSCLLNRDVLI